MNLNLRINLGKLCCYLWVLLIVMSSKTVFFGIIHSSITMALLTIVSAIFLIKKNNTLSIKREQFHVYLTFVFAIIFVSLIYIIEILTLGTVYIGALIQIFQVLFIGFSVTSTLNKHIFIQSYICILFVICCLSLIFFSLYLYDKSIISQISSVYENGSSKYIANPLYTFGWVVSSTNYYSIFYRNAGPWWEPGAFQGFIIIGIIILLQYPYLFKRKKLLLITLIITLLTTQSTTGYIILIITLIAFNQEYLQCLIGFSDEKKKDIFVKIVLYILAAVVAIFAIFLIITSENISNKLSDSNGSFLSRNADIISSLEIIAKYPIFGIGFGDTYNMVNNLYRSTTTATTLLTLASNFGIPFTLYYLYRFIKGCFDTFNLTNFIQKISIFVIFVIILMTETLYLLPFYSIFLFPWHKNIE